MLSKFIEAYDDIERLQQLASKAKKGRKGLQFGCPATILDAAQITRLAWDNLSESAILNCWRHSKCLSHLTESSTQPFPSRYKQVESAVRELTDAISNVHLNAGFAELIDGNEVHLVNRWINLEDDPEIVASDDLLLAKEVEDFLNLSVEESMSISQCDSPQIVQCDMDVPTDPETELRLNLLKYATEAMCMPINDPVLLDLAQKMHAHILSA